MSGELHSEGSSGQAERFWDGHYQEYERRWSGKANAVLVDVAGPLPAGTALDLGCGEGDDAIWLAGPLPAGTALDLGCGEGDDAIWLAGRGWRVTAVDVSVTALDRASAYAVTAGVGDLIDFQKHDLAHTFPTGAFDLVSAQFLQSPIEFPRERVLREAASTVAPGGLLLIVTHASAPSWSWAHRDTVFPTPEEALAALELDPKQWHTERLGAPERQATGPKGEAGTVTDNVIALRRRTH